MWSFKCCLVVSPVCRCLPRPPEGAVDWTLVFGDAGLDCGAERREVSLCQVVIRGRLQLVDVVQQSSLGLCLHLLLGQEVHHFSDTAGVALIHSCCVHSLMLLLQSSQEANCRLQDVCFLHLGVWLLFEELWTQERLELLNAAVDSLSAELLHQRFSELVGESQMLLRIGHCCSDCRCHGWMCELWRSV